MSDESSDFPAMFGGRPDDDRPDDDRDGDDYLDSMKYAMGHMRRAMHVPERINCTRAEFAERTGIWPDPSTIGVCIVSPDGRTVVTEFVFTDEPYPPEKFLTRAALIDIAELERLYKLNQ